MFSKTLVECNGFTYVKVRCLPAAEMTEFPALLLLLREGGFPASVTLKLKHRASQSDMLVSAVYPGDHDCIASLIACLLEKRIEKHEDLYTPISLL